MCWPLLVWARRHVIIALRIQDLMEKAVCDSEGDHEGFLEGHWLSQATSKPQARVLGWSLLPRQMPRLADLWTDLLPLQTCSRQHCLNIMKISTYKVLYRVESHQRAQHLGVEQQKLNIFVLVALLHHTLVHVWGSCMYQCMGSFTSQLVINVLDHNKNISIHDCVVQTFLQDTSTQAAREPVLEPSRSQGSATTWQQGLGAPHNLRTNLNRASILPRATTARGQHMTIDIKAGCTQASTPEDQHHLLLVFKAVTWDIHLCCLTAQPSWPLPSHLMS